MSPAALQAMGIGLQRTVHTFMNPEGVVGRHVTMKDTGNGWAPSKAERRRLPTVTRSITNIFQMLGHGQKSAVFTPPRGLDLLTL